MKIFFFQKMKEFIQEKKLDSICVAAVSRTQIYVGERAQASGVIKHEFKPEFYFLYLRLSKSVNLRDPLFHP